MVNIITKKSAVPKKNWKLIEFYTPISEAVMTGNDFMIRGTANNETTTRNGITYIASELESAAPSFRNKPILVDHSASIKDIVGRTTENVQFDSSKKSIEFEAKIMDSKIKEMINDGRITDVSIGASVKDLQKNEKNGSVTAVGLEGMEISLVAVPGDPGANLANALSESFDLKEMQMSVENIEDVDIELNIEKEDNMEEAEKDVPQEEEVVAEPTEEKVKAINVETVKIDMTETDKRIAALTDMVGALAKKVTEQEETPAPSAETEEDEIPKTPVEDETQGEVGNDEEESEAVEEGLVVERAEIGKGFQIYRDYSNDTGKFNRLCR